jgi:hypothetical protein
VIGRFSGSCCVRVRLCVALTFPCVIQVLGRRVSQRRGKETRPDRADMENPRFSEHRRTR